MKSSIVRKINTGFSLIEVLIAIFLIGIAFVGVVAFFNSSLQSHFEAKNELIAAGLAQEGSELLRNYRDYRVLHDDATWADLVNGANSLPACTRIDYKTLTTSNHRCYGNSTGDNVCLNAQGRYEQCSSGGVGFRRTIEVTCEDENNDPVPSCSPASVTSLRVISKVTWGTSNERKTEATDRLYENEF